MCLSQDKLQNVVTNKHENLDYGLLPTANYNLKMNQFPSKLVFGFQRFFFFELFGYTHILKLKHLYVIYLLSLLFVNIYEIKCFIFNLMVIIQN